MMRLDKRPWWRLSPLVWTLLLAWGAMLAAWWFMQDHGVAEATLPRVPTEEAVMPAVPPASAMASEEAPVSTQALQAQSGEQLASDLAAQYRQPDQALLARHQGRPMRVLGRVLDLQVSEAGVVVLQMDAGTGLPPLRMVMAAGAGASGAPQADQVAALACVHGGMVMGEPLLRDCRLIRIDNP